MNRVANVPAFAGTIMLTHKHAWEPAHTHIHKHAHACIHACPCMKTYLFSAHHLLDCCCASRPLVHVCSLCLWVCFQEEQKNLKAKMREKVRPKLGKIDIDYQKLHDAFFRFQTKPKMTIHGDLYYEVTQPPEPLLYFSHFCNTCTLNVSVLHVWCTVLICQRLWSIVTFYNMFPIEF